MELRLESVLKFVEIPFIFSIIITPNNQQILHAKDIGPELLPLLLVGGMFAGILAIVDPFGKITKGLVTYFHYGNKTKRIIRIFYFLNTTDKGNSDDLTTDFLIKIKPQIRHGINVGSLNGEINKIVSMCYFLVIMIFFSFALTDSTYNQIDQILGDMPINNMSCNIECKITTTNSTDNSKETTKSKPHILNMIIYAGMPFVLFTIFMNMLFLSKKVRTVSIYLHATRNKFAEGSVVKNMKDSILEQRWELAESWSHHYAKTYGAKE